MLVMDNLHRAMYYHQNNASFLWCKTIIHFLNTDRLKLSSDYLTMLILSLLICLTVGWPTSGASVVYYVTPSQPPNSDCPQGGLCLTLEDYARNSSEIFHGLDNVSLLLLNGKHILNHSLVITNKQQILLTGLDMNNSTSSPHDFLIQVEQTSTSIAFENISFIGIQDVKIQGIFHMRLTGCTTILSHVALNGAKLDDGSLDLNGGNFSVSYTNITNVYISATCLTLVTNISEGSIYIFKSNVIESSIKYYRNSKYCLKDVYHHSWEIHITNSTIEYIKNLYPIKVSVNDGENIHIGIESSSCIGCLTMEAWGDKNNVKIEANRSQLTTVQKSPNGAIVVSLRETCKNSNISLIITETNITDSPSSGLLVGVDLSRASRVDIVLIHCNLSGNTDGALVVPLHKDSISKIGPFPQAPSFKSRLKIYVRDSTFDRNGLAIGTKIKTFSKTDENLDIKVKVENCILSENKRGIKFIRNFGQGLDLQTSILSIYLKNMTMNFNELHYPPRPALEVVSANLTIENSVIASNNGTAVKGYFSEVTLRGQVLFADNIGIKGGALALYHSRLNLYEFCNVTFSGNSAKEEGGAIYVKQFPYVLTESSVSFLMDTCFFDVKTQSNYNYSYFMGTVVAQTHLLMSNNEAGKGGDDIYGGSLSLPCRYWYHGMSQYNLTSIFRLERNGSISSISSDPKRVCLCNSKGEIQCANMDYIFSTSTPRYPGEVFTVPAALVGNDFGTIPGIVYSTIQQENANASLAQNQYIQEISDHRKCTSLEFSIQSPSTNYTLTIKLNASRLSNDIKLEQYTKDELEYSIYYYSHWKEISRNLLQQPVYINVPIVDCPNGFKLSTTPPYVCKCHPKLEQSGISRCVITNHTGWVYRSGTIWVSASSEANRTNGFIFHRYCPYDYCNSENTSLELEKPDSQCFFNRSGVLCGGCQDDLSIALGTSKCLPCDNRYISLLLVFAAVGIVLVFLIKILDLTVAKGTMSGLVLYANIVWVNKSIFFPTTKTVHPALHFLKTFVAWLNLDLGIETCFIEGLNAYWKTWLQFVFPIYIWSIAGLMILSSHYSTRASRIFGNNSVPVLATLIILSYNKLLRTIVTSLGFSLLEYPHGPRLVWSFDGNVAYFGVAHTVLFLVALAVLLVLWLPYTAVLFSLQWLRRKSHLKPLRWINRWKPFFDAYFGQLKPKHQYWVGLLLLVRVCLLVLFAAVSAVAPTLNILAIDIVGITLLGYITVTGHVYKSWHLSLLETSFIINLTVLAGGTLFMQAIGKSNMPVIYTSVGIAFIKFLAIVFHQTWQRVKTRYESYRRQHVPTQNPPTEELRPVRPTQNFIQYREPLLDSQEH